MAQAKFPVLVFDDGRAMRARIAIPKADGSLFVVEGECIYGPAHYEVGALFDGKLLKGAAKGVKDAAKKVAKNKAFQAIAKTAPIWGNLIPPPAGQVVAAGAAAAMIAKKVSDAAKSSKNPTTKAKAQKFVANAQKEKVKKVATAKAALKVSTTLKAAGAPPAARKAAIKKVVIQSKPYVVIAPDGTKTEIPASKVA